MPPLSPTKLRVYRSIQRDPAAEFTRQVFEMREEIRAALDKVGNVDDSKVKSAIRELLLTDPKFMYVLVDKTLAEIRELRKGDDGYSPKKGEDFFTEGDKEELIEMLIPHIPDPIQGDPGADADEDSLVTRLKEELAIDEDAVVGKLLKRLGKPEKGKDADQEVIMQGIITQILPVFEKLLEERDTKEEKIEVPEIISIADVPGLQQDLEDIKKAISRVAQSKTKHGGGGDIVVAGTNITITRTAGGKRQITATGGGSGANFEVPAGLVNDSNVTFVVLHDPIYIIVNGQQYFVGTGTYLSYDSGTKTITLSSAVGTDGFIMSAY